MKKKNNDEPVTENKHNNVVKRSRKTILTLKNDILGLGLAFVIASITYSTYVVWVGTTGVGPKILLTPQMLFAAYVVYRVFSKTFK